MAYADLLDDEGINSQYLAVLKPRRIVTGFTLVSGNIYKVSFTRGIIIRVLDDGTALTEASSSSVSSNEFFYDTTNQELFIDVGGNPSSSQIVVTYEIYLGTFDAHINRIPTNSSTTTVYFEPLIVRSPLIKASSKDILFGFLPSFSATLAVSNASKELQDDVHESSFSNVDVDLYHWLGDLENTNIKLVLKSICVGLNYNDNETTFSLQTDLSIFSNEYQHASGTSFFNETDFPNVDPQKVLKPIREVFGVVDGFVPVNIDYEADSPTTSDNRDWVAINGTSNLGSVTVSVSNSGTPTATTTPIDDADGLRVGDTIWNTTASQYATITAVNKGASPNIVTHTTWTTATAADSITRSFIGNIKILKTDGTLVEPLFGRDYTEYTDGSNNVAGFTFTASMETNLSISTLEPNDVVSARVYGHKNTTTLGGGGFGTNSDETLNLTDSVVIIWELLKRAGLEESELDNSSFTTLQAAISDEVGFAIPKLSSNDNYPTYKDLIIDLTKTILAKFYQNDDNEWAISQLGPISSTNKTIEDDEILKGSFNYQYDYKDIASNVVVNYAFQEASSTGSLFSSSRRVQKSSTVAANLHGVDRQFSFDSLHFDSDDADSLADRLNYIFGERRGTLIFRTKNRFFNTELDDNIKVTRERLPGFAFVTGTDRSRDLAVIKTSKSLREITIELDDQKGIEDNSGSW